MTGSLDAVPIPVYWSHTPAKATPDFVVSRADALIMRERGEAFPINRGRALRMRVAQACLAPVPTRVIIRDSSCYMGERVIFANACGSRYAAALAEGWQPNHNGFLPMTQCSGERADMAAD
jgi:hypothetical protein